MLSGDQFSEVKSLIGEYLQTIPQKDLIKEFAMKGLMSRNKKLEKGERYNLGLELLPSVLAPGLNTCPGAGECKFSCLAFSGVGNVLMGKKMFKENILTSPLKAKARRTQLFINDRVLFEEFVTAEIVKHAVTAKAMGSDFRVRLNVTSDIDWLSFTSRLRDIKFYDYTKVWDRVPSENYHLTFSASEKTSDEDIIKKLDGGYNVAVVFPGKLPHTHLGFPVINGDDDDDRCDDPPGHVVGLRVKSTIGGGDKSSVFVQNSNKGE